MEIDYNNIEQYIQGELTGNKLIEFEGLLEKDESLRKKVNFYQYSLSVLSDKQVASKADEEKLAKINPILKELRNEYFINKTATTEIPQKATQFKSTVIKRLLPFAALAAAAALLLFMLLPQLQKQSNPEIAQLNFRPYRLSTNPMGADDTATFFEEGKRNYNKGNFEEANKQFTDFLKEVPKAPDVWLAKGCAAFALNNINTAINSFEKVIEIDNSGISHPDANWYLALCYLKKETPEKAVYHLKKIKEGADNYGEAKQLLRQIE